MKKILNIMRRAINKINTGVEQISAILYFVLVCIIIIITLQAAALCFIYLQLLNNKEVFIPVFEFINIWGLLDEPVTNYNIYANINDVKTRIEFLMNFAIGISGMLLSIVTCVSYARRVVAYRKQSCFQKREILETGHDDIELMCKYFSEATYVAVYSHSFSWITNNVTMRNILRRLAKRNKLKLYTNDNINDVKKRLQNCARDLLGCLYETDVSVHFSYVERNNVKYILYRQENSGKIYVIVVNENRESQYLLQVIGNLVK